MSEWMGSFSLAEVSSFGDTAENRSWFYIRWNSIGAKTYRIFHGDVMAFHVEYSMELPWKTLCSMAIPKYSTWNPMASPWKISCFPHGIPSSIKLGPLFCRIVDVFIFSDTLSLMACKNCVNYAEMFSSSTTQKMTITMKVFTDWNKHTGPNSSFNWEYTSHMTSI